MQTKFIEQVVYEWESKEKYPYFKLGTHETNDEAYNVLMIPKSYSYNQKFEAVMNLTVNFLQNVSMNKEDVCGHLNKQGIDMDIAYFMQELSRFLGYAFNSSSWEQQEFRPYDVVELRDRLEKLKILIK